MEKPGRYGPFNMRDQRDGFMEPLAGRLTMEQIASMNDSVLDERLAAHLKDQPVFRASLNQLKGAKGLEKKRALLGVLEGYHPGGEVLANWLNEQRGNPEEPLGVPDIIRSMISKNASRAYKNRQKYTKSELLYETEVTPPLRPETAKLLQKINDALRYKGMGAMSLREILAPISVVRDESEMTSENIRWTVPKLLNLFYLSISTELNDEELGKKMQTTRFTITTARKKHFTKSARNVIRRARGYNVLSEDE
jgi:hypothetical protein